MPLSCASPSPPLEDGQSLRAIAAPLAEAKRIEEGAIDRAAGAAGGTDFLLPPGGAGGPVFAEDGRVVGLTSPIETGGDRRRIDIRVVPTGVICELLATADEVIAAAGAVPDGTRLPVDPTGPSASSVAARTPARSAE